jgi:nicotinate-nucleotide adenylyltransferase
MQPSTPPLIALLGGSFNPPHIGHLRLALEVREILAPREVLLVPCATPPHKPADNLLPFAWRLAMLRASVRGLPGLRSSPLEAERPGPSYTVDTLAALAGRHPRRRPAFILGGDDFPQLPEWKEGRHIPELADIIVLPRQEKGEESFLQALRANWPHALPLPSPHPAVVHAFGLPHGGRILYLPRPRLEISSSLIRSRWLQGQSLDFLIPPAVGKFLDANAEQVRRLWEPAATFRP